MKNLNWLFILSGLWLIASPFILEFTGNPLALWSNLIIGVIIILAGLYNQEKN